MRGALSRHNAAPPWAHEGRPAGRRAGSRLRKLAAHLRRGRGERSARHGPPGPLRAVAVLTPLDWSVLGVYLVAIVGFGLWMGRGNRRIDDFFLADRKMRWWAAGLSVMATQISAITFVGTTGQAYTQGMSFIVFYFGLPFAMVVLCATLVPFFYRARVYTAYQYLEQRFDPRTRTLTSLLFLLSRGLSVGVTLYAPSVVLSVILGWSETSTILLMGGSTIVYVVYGGNKSVMWTDVVQMAIIWLGILVCVGVAVAQLPGGLAGLVIAVIFAAAMSTLSGEFNSLATASLVDFYQRFVRTSASDAHYLAVSRIFTAFWGVFACGVALQAGRLGSAIEVVNRFGSYFYGSILGVFALAVLTPRATARGAFYGLWAGMAAVFLVSRYSDVAFLWYNVVGAVTVFAVGLLLTALAR